MFSIIFDKLTKFYRSWIWPIYKNEHEFTIKNSKKFVIQMMIRYFQYSDLVNAIVT